MSLEVQKVVVILDASRYADWNAIRWVLGGLSLNPGDELTLFQVLHRVNNPSILTITGAGKKLRSRGKSDSNSIFGPNVKMLEEEITRKMELYQQDEDMLQFLKQCEMDKIKFQVEVLTGSSPKEAALQAIKTLNATWVILDRQMKKDKKYFMEKLSCQISRMKRNNTIQQLRGPKSILETKLSPGKSTTFQISYDEMIPGMPEDDFPQTNSPSSQKSILGKEQGSYVQGSPQREFQKLVSLSTSSPDEHILPPTFSTASLVNTDASSSMGNKSSPPNFRVIESARNADPNTDDKQSHFSLPDIIEKSRTSFFSRLGSNRQQKQQVGYTEIIESCQSQEEFENSLCSVCKNRRPKIGWKKEFSYAELREATEGFDEKNYLSEGGFGSVYRGRLRNGLEIAVKQHKDASCQGEREFKSEVHVLSKLRHQNLVMLLGSCSEGSHRLLVYEYVCDGSLDKHLSGQTQPLNWRERIKIALGAAKGLEYLHENNTVHRDMRPNNILVTHDHEALLGDFGLAKTQYDDSDYSPASSLVGTVGYVAPEYVEYGMVSTKTDVYSFGVVLLQLITGKGMTDSKHGGKSLLEWARPLLKDKKYPDLIDKRIVDSHDVHQLFCMVQVAEKCLSKDPYKRYTMERVVKALNDVQDGNKWSIGDLSPT